MDTCIQVQWTHVYKYNGHMYTSTMDTRIQVQWTNKRQQWIHVNIFTSRGLFLWDSLGLSLFPFDPDLGLC